MPSLGIKRRVDYSGRQRENGYPGDVQSIAQQLYLWDRCFTVFFFKV